MIDANTVFDSARDYLNVQRRRWRSYDHPTPRGYRHRVVEYSAHPYGVGVYAPRLMVDQEVFSFAHARSPW